MVYPNAIKMKPYELFGKLWYWLAIFAAGFALFMLAWKVFGHSPDFNSLVTGFVIANVIATFGLYYKMGGLSSDLRHHIRYSSRRMDVLSHEVSSLREQFKNDFQNLRSEFKNDFRDLKAEFKDLRTEFKELRMKLQ